MGWEMTSLTSDPTVALCGTRGRDFSGPAPNKKSQVPNQVRDDGFWAFPAGSMLTALGWKVDVGLDYRAKAVKASPMTDVPRSTGQAYWPSVFIGAYAGIIFQMAITTWSEPVVAHELWAIPVVLVVYGLLAVPFVAVGLALLGLPVTVMLRRRARDRWVGALAAVWGCLAGKLTFFVVDHFLFFGLYDILKVSFLDVGVMYGLPTGLAWWTLKRRELAGP